MTGKKPPENQKRPEGLSAEDRHLWDFVTRNIQPLLHRERRHRAGPPASGMPDQAIRPKNSPRQKPVMEPHYPDITLKTTLLPLSVAPACAASGTGGVMGGIPDGIDRRTAGRLRKGQMVIDGRLDLHGLRQGEAQEKLSRFLMRGYHDGRRCVLIITGKGAGYGDRGEAGVLRRQVPVWLGMPPLAPLILGHSPARPQDGGDGALYVLLRRKR